MRGITSDILERRQKIQSDLEDLNVRRDVLVKRLAALDMLLEMERELGDTSQDTIVPPVPLARRGRVPLIPKILRILGEHPDWALLPRNEQMQRISQQLIVEGHDFNGKDAFLAVGFALTQLKRRNGNGKETTLEAVALNGDDGPPGQE